MAWKKIQFNINARTHKNSNIKSNGSYGGMGAKSA